MSTIFGSTDSARGSATDSATDPGLGQVRYVVFGGSNPEHNNPEPGLEGGRGRHRGSHVRGRRSGKGMAAGLLAGALVLGAGGGLALSAVYHHPTTVTAVDAASAGVGGTVEAAADAVLPSVVKIEVSGNPAHPNAQGQVAMGTGSGVIVSANGDIVTNNHVAALAAHGGKMRIDFGNGTTTDATIVGLDPSTDIAVVKAQGVSGLKPATIGSSADLKVGQEVVAVGAPLGLNATVTNGIVSALNRPADVGAEVSNDTANVVYPAIQTDAAINPGNSGGALVNLAGQVIGISSANMGIPNPGDPAAQTGSIGLGMAIPIDNAMPIVNQILSGQKPTHAQLGIGLPKESPSQTPLFAPGGAQITAIEPGSSAANLGIKTGDTITRVNGQAIPDADALIATIHGFRPGDTVTISWTHQGQPHTERTILGSDATTQ